MPVVANALPENANTSSAPLPPLKVIVSVLPSAFWTVIVPLANGVIGTPVTTQPNGESAGGATQL